MKKGVNITCFPKGLPISDALSMSKDAGFGSLELFVSEAGEFSLNTSTEEVKALARLAESKGMSFCGVGAAFLWKAHFLAPDPAVQARARDGLDRCLEFAAILRAGTVLVIPPIVNQQLPYGEAYRLGIEEMARLAERASQYGLHLGLENGGVKFLMSPLEFAAFLDAVDSPNFGAYLDTANVMLDGGYPEQWVATLGPRLRQLHLKDYLGQVFGQRIYTHPLQGTVDWRAVMKALRAAKYDGFVVAEVPPYSTFADHGIRNLRNTMDLVLSLGEDV